MCVFEMNCAELNRSHSPQHVSHVCRLPAAANRCVMQISAGPAALTPLWFMEGVSTDSWRFLDLSEAQKLISKLYFIKNICMSYIEEEEEEVVVCIILLFM